MKPVVGVLLGDASGIGAEIVAKAFDTEKHAEEKANYIILGDERILKRAETIVGKNVDYRLISREELNSNWDGIVMLDTGNVDPEKAPFSVVSGYCGQAVIDDMATACELFAEGLADGICFAPFNKEAMRTARPDISSELDIFIENSVRLGLPVSPELGEMNVVDGLWTTRVTSHIPMVELGKHLTYDKIINMIRLADNSCRSAGINIPRIMIAALNPHCGEGGLCGTEEQTLIKPAMEKARSEGRNVVGMYSADTVFLHAFKGEADVVVTMYHDQGQIALKLKGFSHAVTVNAGFAMPIGTPAHGTAHDIAGKGIASETAFETALGIVINQSVSVRRQKQTDKKG